MRAMAPFFADLVEDHVDVAGERDERGDTGNHQGSGKLGERRGESDEEAVEQLHVLARSVGENDVDETEIGIGRVGIPRRFAS